MIFSPEVLHRVQETRLAASNVVETGQTDLLKEMAENQILIMQQLDMLMVGKQS